MGWTAVYGHVAVLSTPCVQLLRLTPGSSMNRRSIAWLNLFWCSLLWPAWGGVLDVGDPRTARK